MRVSIFVFLLLGASNLVLADGASEFMKRCSVCHGENAEKPSLGVSAVIAGWKEEQIIEKLKAYKVGSLNQYGYGSMMGGQATKLSEKQMREVAKYISTLNPPLKNEIGEYVSEVLTPEQIAYKAFLRQYFIENPRYGNIREANRLWEEKQKIK